MKALKELRLILRDLAQEVEILPAVGGAIQDMERPDMEEREDQAVNEDEKVFETIFERQPSGERPPLYTPVPPVGRQEHHLFRFFIDGSFRSYFLGSMLEHERETPVHFAQLGACLLRREDDGSVRRESLGVRHLLLAGKKRISPDLWQRLEEMSAPAGLTLIDLNERDVLTKHTSDADLRDMAGGKVRFEMRRLESEMMELALGKLAPENWLLTDGSLLFDPIARILLAYSETIPRVIGVSKNFRKDPQFVLGRGPRAERRSIYKLLADLAAEHRTAVYSAQEGKAAFWYVRLREQRHLDYPLMGVVKVEVANPSQEAVPSDLIDRLSQALVAERQVTPHGQDRRWHSHLYPIFLAERAVKESLLSREVVQQFLKWR
jgi:hypothetical protein